MTQTNTSGMPQMDYVCNQVAKARIAFKKLRNYNRRVAWAFAATATLLSAAATVALGLKSDEKTSLDVIALVASGLATVISSTAGVFSHRKLWHLNNLALTAFDQLDREINFRKADPAALSAAEIRTFNDRYDQISADIDRKWVDTYAVN